MKLYALQKTYFANNQEKGGSKKMEAYRIQTKLISETLKLPQISKWIGQEVEIIILPIQEVEKNILQKINSLVGTVLDYIDPFEAIEEDSWEALH